MIPGRVRFLGVECRVVLKTYSNSGTAIRLERVSKFAEPVATASVWIPGLAVDEVAIKDYAENAGMLDALLAAGIVLQPHRYARAGFVSVPVCRFAKPLEAA